MKKHKKTCGSAAIALAVSMALASPLLAAEPGDCHQAPLAAFLEILKDPSTPDATTLLAPEFRFRSSLMVTTNREEYVKGWQLRADELESATFETNEIFCEESAVVARVTFRGTHRQGVQVASYLMLLLRFEEGSIIEAHLYHNPLDVLLPIGYQLEKPEAP